MSGRLVIVWFLPAFFIIQISHGFDPSESFDRNIFLDTTLSNNGGAYRLYWKVFGDEIIFEAHVATLGWIGLGFSPTGGMTGADIMVGGVRNGQPYIYDRHATGTVMPVMDAIQDYQALYAAENATHTVLKFKRKLNTCDRDDWTISNDTVKLIWAYNPTDATSENEFNMHEKRGTRSLMLLEPSKSSRESMPSDVSTFDIKVTNVAIPSDYHTLYECKIVKLPDRPKAHIIKYEPIIEAGHEAYVHHILIYHCLYNMSNYVDKQEECFSRDHTTSSDMYICTQRYFVGWAIGGEAVVYASNLGLPIFEKDVSPYMMLEIHYDNSKYVPGLVDNSGIRLYLTSQLRPTEIGSIILGMNPSPTTMVLPPGQNQLTLKSFCDSSCTKNLPSDGLNFFGGFLHEHLHGKGVRLRHIRHGVELAPIFQDDFYDFNYQEQRVLQQPRVVLPNDTLIVECDFTTASDKNATFGGFTTKDEMCFVFVDYYPKSDSLVGCYAGPTVPSYSNAMGATFNMSQQKFIGPAGTFDSLKDYALATSWQDDKIFSDNSLPRTPKGQIFQEKIDSGLYYEACLSKDRSQPPATNINSKVKRAAVTDDMRMEKVSQSYFPSLPFPKPTVPFVKVNLCPSQSSQPQATTQSGSSMTTSTYNSGSVNPKPSMDDPAFVGSAGAQYTRHLVMDPNGNYHLFWRYDDTEVIFEVQVRAQGWVGLGFSPTGGMAGADIVHAFIDNSGSPQLTDRYAPATGRPQEDPHQDYRLVRGTKNDTHIIVVFSRKKFTCDDRDLPLTNDTMKLIWAMSDVVPVDKNNFQMHQPMSRGTKNVRLFEKQMVELPLPSDVKNLDIFVTNVSIPDDYHTLYWCQVFQLPQWQKHHVIRFDPVIQKGNEFVVHHMLLYECKTDMSQYMAKPGEPCFDRTGTNYSPLMECTTNYVAGWAVGAGSQIYPSDVGLPMFGSGASKYMMMEMHYDNSNYLKGKVDNSGFRIYLTPTLRPIESGGMLFGVPVGSEYMMLPAGQPEFTFYTYCYSECTSWIPPDGFTVFSGIPHTHLAGRKVRLHHIRNGVQLPDLFNDENYDFNYQASIVKTPPVKILPGDEFIVECVYNTSGRNETTYGGYSTRQEMCLIFGDFYPRPKSGGFLCMGYPYFGSEDFKKLFNGNYDDKKEFYTLPNGTNITSKQFAETMVKFPNQSFIQQYQNIIKNSDQLVYCDKGPKSNSSQDDWGIVYRPGPVQITKPLAPEMRCLNDAPNNNNGSTGGGPGSTGNNTIARSFVGSGGETYSHHLVLDPNGKYHLFWRFDDSNITFEVQAAAKGWVALGFSPNGGMPGADIIHVFVDKSGNPVLTDRYVDGSVPSMPQEDPHQDVQLIRGNKNDTHITASFQRKRITCDKNDMSLTTDNTHLIYAFSDTVPTDKNNFVPHDGVSRGAKSVHLFDLPLLRKTLPNDVIIMNVTVNKVDPLIEKGNENVVHHIVLYGCGQKDMSSKVGKGEACFDKTGTIFSDMLWSCPNFVAVWAIGGEGTIYPDSVGMPMFEPNGNKYYMLEMHYDNPRQLKDKFDSSGFQLFLSPTLRPIEGGQVQLGTSVGSETGMIPAKQENFTWYGYCSMDCTNTLPNGGVTVLGGLLHTHFAGRKIRLRQFRNGKQLPDIMNDDHYDFNYQESRQLQNPVVILPGDQLVVECEYNTMDRTATTYAGYASRQEMCQIFLDVYPKPGPTTFMCLGYLRPKTEWKIFGAKFNDNSSGPGELLDKNMTLAKFAESQIKFDNASWVQLYQQRLRDGEQIIYCSNRFANWTDRTLDPFLYQFGYPKFTSPWKPVDICLRDPTNTVASTTAATVATIATTRAPVATTKRASSLKAYGTVVSVISLLQILCFSKGLFLFY